MTPEQFLSAKKLADVNKPTGDRSYDSLKAVKSDESVAAKLSWVLASALALLLVLLLAAIL